MFGFLSGWVSFIVGFSAPIAAGSIAFSEYFYRAFPDFFLIMGNDPWLMKKLLSITIIIVFTIIHSRGVEFGSIVQNYLTVFKIALIVGLIVIGFSLGSGNVQHFTQSNHFSFNMSGWQTIGLSLMWIMFSYSGWNASTYIGSEIRDPKKNLPLSLMYGTGVVVILYLCINLVYVYAIPPDDMKGVISIGGLAVKNMFGGNWENIFSALVSIALLSSISAFIILGPRVYYAMARRGHFFTFVSKVDPESHVPTKSIILQCSIAIIMVMSGTFDQILTYMGFSLGIFPLLAIIGVFKLKTANGKYILPSVIYILSGVSILMLAYFERPVESSIAILTVLVGIPAYYFFIRNKEKGIT